MAAPRNYFNDEYKSPEYKAWQSMKGRCYAPNNSSYQYYGGRGIIVCDKWLKSFQHFLEDMGKKPSPESTLERIDSDRNYEPGNCYWASIDEQNRNRSCVKLTQGDVASIRASRLTTRKLAIRYGVSQRTILGIITYTTWKTIKDEIELPIGTPLKGKDLFI
jgi:hypothetical protein